ncbi:MAG: ATP synthase F1 subunit delta, partial [Cyclobacteriaceae bacterium]
MNQSQIPVRYARALFLSGKEKKILDKISNDILILDSFFKNNPSINAWLKSPVIKAEDKKNLFRKEFEDRISKITLKFINLVINKKREQYFTDIFRNFLQFHKT